MDGLNHSIIFCKKPINEAPASVPQMLPTPPTTTVIKLWTIYSEPNSDVTFEKRPIATPAIPAIPHPKPKVSMLIFSGFIPIFAAIAGFCVTDLVSKPNLVFFITNKRSEKKINPRINIAILI